MIPLPLAAKMAPMSVVHSQHVAQPPNATINGMGINIIAMELTVMLLLKI